MSDRPSDPIDIEERLTDAAIAYDGYSWNGPNTISPLLREAALEIHRRKVYAEDMRQHAAEWERERDSLRAERDKFVEATTVGGRWDPALIILNRQRADRAEAERDALREALEDADKALVNNPANCSRGTDGACVAHPSDRCPTLVRDRIRSLFSQPSEPRFACYRCHRDHIKERLNIRCEPLPSEPRAEPCAHKMHYHVLYKPEEARCANPKCDAVIECHGHGSEGSEPRSDPDCLRCGIQASAHAQTSDDHTFVSSEPRGEHSLKLTSQQSKALADDLGLSEPRGEPTCDACSGGFMVVGGATCGKCHGSGRAAPPVKEDQ